MQIARGRQFLRPVLPRARPSGPCWLLSAGLYTVCGKHAFAETSTGNTISACRYIRSQPANRILSRGPRIRLYHRYHARLFSSRSLTSACKSHEKSNFANRFTGQWPRNESAGERSSAHASAPRSRSRSRSRSPGSRETAGLDPNSSTNFVGPEESRDGRRKIRGRCPSRERFAIGRSPRQVSSSRGLLVQLSIPKSKSEGTLSSDRVVSAGQGGMSRDVDTGVHYNINFGVQRSW